MEIKAKARRLPCGCYGVDPEDISTISEFVCHPHYREHCIKMREPL